jgi:hypothetical protein
VLVRGVEGSKLCLFSVIMPAKCVSSISPRFHYRRLAFCFLPLGAILESPPATFVEEVVHCIFGCLCQKSGGHRCLDSYPGPLFCSPDLYVCFCARTMLFLLLWLCSII